MAPQSELEIKGNFFTHPFAEVIAEIAHARLTGSLRVSDKDKKCVIYFKRGRVVFAVSNARTSRLFDILLRRNKLTKDDLAKIPNFANDFEFSTYLQEQGFLSKDGCERLFVEQIEGIIIETLSWPSAEWTFSSLARIRDGVAFAVNVKQILVDYSRSMAVDQMLGRFRTLDEKFTLSDSEENNLTLTPDEAFILSRADDSNLTASRLISIAPMPESTILQSIYTLWLGGLLTRLDWQPAFSAASVNLMQNAKLELRKEAKLAEISVSATKQILPEVPVEVPEKESEAAITIDEYLDRVENAATFYDILGVGVKADVDELKRAYFGLARIFHPDRFHAEGGDIFKRIQSAFTELAQAHETLKNPETREIYDYRVRKELAEREKRIAAGLVGEPDRKVEQAGDNFERGFGLLMNNAVEESLPFLARAAHFEPGNARYRAYYGKALSIDPNRRYKAEAEMQAALKIDPNNPTFRIFLAEFFIQFNLLKRAEGELTRLLAIFPSNREACELLDSLKT